MLTQKQLKAQSFYVPIKGSTEWSAFEANLVAQLGRRLTRKELRFLVKSAHCQNKGKANATRFAEKEGRPKYCRTLRV